MGILCGNRQKYVKLWLGIAPRPERMEKTGKVLEIPENLYVFSLIACGYPAEEKKQQDRYEEARVHYRN